MNTVRRRLASAASRANARRFASTEHGAHAAPKDESMGAAFYITFGMIPLSYAVYLLSRPGADGQPSGLSKAINKYSTYKENWSTRNSRHTAMIEQAAFDRNLFQSDKGSAHVNLRFPEIFNTGSPYNVSAGQGPRNMDSVVAHYEKLNADAEEKKAKALAAKET